MAELLEKILVESVFPILQRDEFERFNIAGSAVFIEHRQSLYLVTASHVLNENGSKYPLYLSLDKQALLLSGGFLFTDTQDIDLAFLDLSLDQEILHAMLAYKPLSIDQDEKIDNFSRVQYLAFGFPASKFRHDKNTNILDYKKLLNFVGNESPDHIYKEIGRSKNSYTVIDYIKNKQKKQDETSLTGVDPFGASGGGLFKLYVDEKDRMILCSLNGILIEWRGKKAMVATKLVVLREFIDHYIRNKSQILELNNF